MTAIRLLAAMALFAGLAACTPMAGDDTVAGPEPRAPAPGAVASGQDECGAAGLQNLVGTSVGVLDPSALPEPRRIIFPGQAVTMDLRAERLNVEIGTDDEVARVFCG